MITYNEIYEALRKEKYSEQIQPLDKNFISEISDYLKQKKEIANKDEDMFSDAIIKTKKQLENAIILFKELMLRRKKKILNLAFIATETGINKRDFDNMLDFEKEMFEGIMQTIENTDKKIHKQMSNEENDAGLCLLCFNENVGEFLGTEGEKLGPFTKGEIANLPKQIADILIEAGKAEIVEGE